MKWETPARASGSSREPAPIQKPSAIERTPGTCSLITRSPPVSVVSSCSTTVGSYNRPRTSPPVVMVSGMTDRDRPRRRTLHRLLVLLGLAVTAVFGYLAVRNAHLDEVVDALGELDVIWLVPAALLLAVCVVLRAQRWRSLF